MPLAMISRLDHFAAQCVRTLRLYDQQDDPYVRMQSRTERETTPSTHECQLDDVRDPNAPDFWCMSVSLKSAAVSIGVTLLVFYTVATTLIFALIVAGDVPSYLHFVNHPTELIVATSLLYVVHIIFNVLLMQGARRCRRGLVLAWVVYHALCLLTATVIWVRAVAKTWHSIPMLYLTMLGMALLAPAWYSLRVGIILYTQQGYVNSMPSGRRYADGKTNVGGDRSGQVTAETPSPRTERVEMADGRVTAPAP